MTSTLPADAMTEPSPEEIARMRAELDEMYIEAEKTLARMDANRPEIDLMRAETKVILDSLALHRRTTPEELEQEKPEQFRQIAEINRQLAEADQELLRPRLERDNIRRERGLSPASADFWSVTSL
ncbi:MAG: hypothetical protein ACRYFS_08220 [Janthinobacterium lividum]